MAVIPHTDITYRVIGAAFVVHNELGPGLKEVMYHRALANSLQQDGLKVEFEKQVEVRIDDKFVGYLYIDLLIEGSVVVEAKAMPHLVTSEEVAQVITYLAVTQTNVGLLLNFGRQRLDYKRILPPKKFEDWRGRVRRYVWRPDAASGVTVPAQVIGQPHPFIRSLSVDDLGAN